MRPIINFLPLYTVFIPLLAWSNLRTKNNFDSLRTADSESNYSSTKVTIRDTIEFADSLVKSKFRGSEIYSWAHGDLNGDSRPDFYVICTKDCQDSEALDENSICYQATIYVQDENQKYQMVKSNLDLVHCSNCERTMPQVGIAAHGFSICYYNGSCTKSVVTDNYFHD